MGAMALDFAAIAVVPQALHRPPAPQVMKGVRKRVWLLLYTEGGMWTAAEIGQRLGLAAKKLHSMLGEMVRDQFLTRKRRETVDGDRVVEFGVSGSCSIPRGVTPDEIEALLRMAVGRRA